MAVQKAIEEKGMLDHTIVHGVFVGPARSGKNSIMERLLGKTPSTLSPSTGVAESVVQVKVIKIKSTTFAANVAESIWEVMDFDDEAIKLSIISTESQAEAKPLDGTPDHHIVHVNSSSTEVQFVDDKANENSESVGNGSEASSVIDTKLESQMKSSSVVQPMTKQLVSASTVRSRARLPDSFIRPTELVNKE